MRVLHLLGAREDSGGILSVIRNLQSASGPHNVEHVVWVHRAYRETRSPSLSTCHGRWLLQESPNHLGLFARSLLEFPRVRQAMATGGFDLAQAHARGTLFVAAALAQWTRWPALYTNHAFARRKGLYRWAAQRTRLHTSVLTPNMARHYGLPMGPHGVSVVSECCADQFFAVPSVTVDPAAGRTRPIRLVGLGNIIRWKNWHVLLHALARLDPSERKQIEFHHWGPVPIEAECRRYNEEVQSLIPPASPAGCFFHGLSLNVEEPLRQADWFILPSTNEPCSVALIEALAMGLPVIVSDSGGNVDIVDHGRTGLRFVPDDPDDLARQLRRILRREVQPAPPSAIRDSVRHRSATTVTAEYVALYRQMLAVRN